MMCASVVTVTILPAFSLDVPNAEKVGQKEASSRIVAEEECFVFN